MTKQYSLFDEPSPIIGVVDLETTGFFRQKGLIVEIGIVSLDLGTGEIKPVFDSLVCETGFSRRHTAPPYGWIFNNSSLQYADVEKAPSLTGMYNQIQEILHSFTHGITAYNSAFDFEFLRARSFQFSPLPCPMLAATPVVNLPPAGNHSNPKWPSVQEAWNFLFGDTGYVETHRALDDALHEAKIVYQLYKDNNYRLK